jgi:cyclophilin family peptidyl-prolyl cis-trans isomerase
MPVIRAAAAVFALLAVFAAPPALAQDPVVALQTSKGEIRIELEPERAPNTVENFLTYVRNGHYDGTVFHRVIPGFMIQGGGFTTDYERKETRAPIRNEADNGLTNDRGTIAMARTADPHSATAQFFINVADNDFLDHRGKTRRGWGYAVFGEVISGLGVVDRIVAVETGQVGPFPKDAPLEPVVIERARVE